MAAYRFDCFHFDTEQCCLTRDGESIALRPKTARLLTYLIENRDRILPKSEIALEVWATPHVQDHTLFQAVSELRKLPARGKLILTYPNSGYKWVAPIAPARARPSLPVCVAASIAGFLIVITTMTIPLEKQNKKASYSSLPALSAFSQGAAALRAGNNEQAAQLFEFALTENPDSEDSRLMLAESLFHQNKLQASAEYLRPMLHNASNEKRKAYSEYGKMAARNLMSHISERQGKPGEALALALESRESNVRAYCSVEVADQRVKALLATAEMSAAAVASSRISDREPLANEGAFTPNSNVLSENAAPNDKAERCDKMEKGAADGDPSACVEPESVYWYANSTGNSRAPIVG